MTELRKKVELLQVALAGRKVLANGVEVANFDSLLLLLVKLMDEVEAWRNVRGITDQREYDETYHAASGLTFSANDLKRATDAAVLAAIATDAAVAAAKVVV